jgi:hypothetical protein
MQLHLETDELNLLANVLMEPGEATPHLAVDDQLLEMVLARDLRFDSDELERVAALLTAEEHGLKESISHEANGARKTEIRHKLTLLERVLEKVDEACVMI